MTVNKITNAPTPNEQIDKINEIIDNLSSSSITVDSALSTTSTNPVQNKVVTAALNGKQSTISDLSTIRSGASAGATAVQPGDLANVATSGSYNDLSNKPTIPSVGNGTLTLQKNGSTVKTFTANSSSNVTANITVPTKTSELTNDSGYTTNTGTVTSVNNVAPVNGNVSLTIPSVGNGTITIKQGGTTKGSFTTNQSGNATIALDAGGGTATTVKINGTSITSSGVADIKTNGTYNASTNKIATMSDLPSAVTETTVSGWGFTKNAGTITGITMNGSSKGTSGVVDLGTVITSHQDISGKANTDLSNCTKPYITNTYHSGASWYRVYSDGFIEQGGTTSEPSAASDSFEISLIKPMTSTNYYVKTQRIGATTSTANTNNRTVGRWSGNVVSLATNKFVIQADKDFPFCWYVCGY